jgi:RNA polymerase-binding protein DksA
MNQADVERYKARLVEMRARLMHEVSDIENAIIEDVTAPGDLSTLPTHLADFDAEGLDRNLALAENEAGILREVEAALERIEQGTYGKCQQCGEEIAAARLDALPYTPFCVRCAEERERAEAAAPEEAAEGGH